MANSVTLSLQDFQQGALVTVAFCCVYMAALVMQGLTRAKYSKQAEDKKEKFVVATDERLYPFTRITGNLLEWSVPFLALFWVALVATHGASLWLGWVYVAARVLYVLLARNGGIRASGPGPMMGAATVPGYLALLGLLWKAVAAVAF